MAARHLKLGRDGEEAARALLKAKGFRVMESNVNLGRVELDLICRDGDTIVFVEVKTRGEGSMGSPEDGLSPSKAGHLARAAAMWLSKRKMWESPCRFDLVAVHEQGDELVLVHHLDVIQLDGQGPMFQPF